MPNARIPIPSLWGGVSKQAPTIRHPNQVERGDNVLFSVKDGLSKRPGTEYLFTITGLTGSANYRLHAIDRDQNEKYLMVYGDSTIRIFEPDGTEAQVNISSDAQSYLDANSADADQLRPVTVADYTLLLNTTVAVAGKQSDMYQIERTHSDYSAMIRHTPAANTNHRALNDEGVYAAGFHEYDPGVGTFATVEFPATAYDEVSEYTVAGANPGGFELFCTRFPCTETGVSVDATGKIITKTGAFAGLTLQDNDHINMTGGTGVTPGFYEIDSKDNDNQITLKTSCASGATANATTEGIGPSGEINLDFRELDPSDMNDVAQGFQDELQGAVHPDVLVEYRRTAAGYVVWTITNPFKGTDATFPARSTRPPSTGFDWSAVNKPFYSTGAGETITAGTGSPSTPTLNPHERWTRIAAPGQSDALLDETTMPIQIVRTSLSPLEFDADTIEWVPRQTGDNDTNPIPSLWQDGAILTDICFHRNRLVLAGDENAVFSQAGDFFNFFIEDHDNIGDADPIDIALSSDKVTLIDFVVPFRSALVIFTKSGNQFELNAPETLTPNTAAITPSTAYRSLEAVRPATMGNQLYFPAIRQGWAQVYEYFYSDAEAANTAADVSAHVEGYLPTTIKTICTALNNNAVLVLPIDDEELYVYRAFWTGTQKVQSAWARYLFDSGDRIVDIAVIGNDCYLLVENGAGYIITKLSIPPETGDTGMPYVVHLDSIIEMTGSYASGETTWDYTITDDTLDNIVLGSSFGANAGTVLGTPTRVDNHTIKITGDYSAGDVYIGRDYTMDVELSRPYIRTQDGSAVVDGELRLLKIATNHTSTGEYDIRIAQINRADRDRTFTPRDGSLIEDEGDYATLVSGKAETTTLSIRNDTPLPSTITSAEHIVGFTPRSQ